MRMATYSAMATAPVAPKAVRTMRDGAARGESRRARAMTTTATA